MAIIIDSFNEKSYSLVINSADKISGTNNNATYSIDWEQFIPRDISNYKVAYSFQSVGGYYSDGVTKIPNITGTSNTLLYSTSPYASTSNSASIAVGVNTFAFSAAGFTGSVLTSAAITAGLYIFVTNVNYPGLNFFPIGTQVLGFTGGTPAGGGGSTVYLSAGALYAVPATSIVTIVSAANISPVTYSSARLLLNFNSSSNSFDTGTKGKSINLGTCQRDIQTTTSKSNTLSTFYCQVPPRCMVRPHINLLTVQLFNNCVFAGGITSYNGNTPATYSITPTNNNFLTDTNQNGSAISTTNDMTPYHLYLEFIPLK